MRGWACLLNFFSLNVSFYFHEGNKNILKQKVNQKQINKQSMFLKMILQCHSMPVLTELALRTKPCPPSPFLTALAQPTAVTPLGRVPVLLPLLTFDRLAALQEPSP